MKMIMNMTIKKAVRTVQTKINKTNKTKTPVRSGTLPRNPIAYAAALEILG